MLIAARVVSNTGDSFMGTPSSGGDVPIQNGDPKWIDIGNTTGGQYTQVSTRQRRDQCILSCVELLCIGNVLPIQGDRMNSDVISQRSRRHPYHVTGHVWMAYS